MQIIRFLSLTICVVAFSSFASSQDVRQWSDATGRFKITGSLIEVKDGIAFIKNDAGKTLRVPVAKLSKADQDFLKGGDNPFEMVEEGTAPTASVTPAPSSSGATASTNPGGMGWSTEKKTNWSRAKQFRSRNDVAWNVPAVDNALPFEGKRASLSKKSNFHEKMHSITVNPVCRRAVVGHSLTFTVPKPLSRLTLIDLESGKSVHSEQVEAHMRPKALLNSGTDVLMVGASDQRKGYETQDQLQIWRFNGTKISKTPSWIPYPEDSKRFGKVTNGSVLIASPVLDNKLLTMSDKGHLALWDIASREPVWHGRVNDRNFAVDVTVDRKLMALVDNKTLMVVKIDSGDILGSVTIPSQIIGWPRVRWSPSGKQLLLSTNAEIKVLDAQTGEWIQEMTFPNSPVAPRGLDFPHEDYALLNGNLLVHLPTKIQVCQYSGAGSIRTIGGVSFIAIQAGEGGIVSPGKFPHPAAEAILTKAKDDPTMFLIHPGVEVAIDVSGVTGPHRQAVQAGLEKAAQASGYRVSASAAIKLVASITGPKQEAVSYIAAGSYIVKKYTSKVTLKWNGKDLWSRSGSNVPGVLMTKQNQTMQQALDEAGKQPNLSIFEKTKFPELMQKPSGDQKGPQRSSALMTSNFTLQGLVDSK